MATARGIQGARGFWDNGATLCLCTHSWARSMGIVGTPSSIFLKVVRHQHEQVDSLSYDFEIEDRDGQRHAIKAFGVEDISRERGYEPPEELLAEFPEVSAEDIRRVPGEVDLLLGMDVVGLHPSKIRTVGHRMLMSSQFGTGRLLVGNVPGNHCGAVNATAMRYARGSWEVPEERVNHVRVASSPSLFEEL